MKKFVRITNIELVKDTDPDYCEWGSYHANRHRKKRKRSDEEEIARQRILNDFAEKCEILAISCLSKYISISEERVLKFKKLKRYRSIEHQASFKELDAVSIVNDIPEFVFEIKSTQSNATIRKGVTQLNRSLDIMHQKWKGVKGCVLIVDLSKDEKIIKSHHCKKINLLENKQSFLNGIKNLLPTEKIGIPIKDLMKLPDASFNDDELDGYYELAELQRLCEIEKNQTSC